ncbi:hypothetical protein [Croceivirga sp. JEA036]|uniref:hypothetical protein n=1 Tax=Croceivirga sp. JEA036 TaxID=2721162 RepID=UPI001439DD38|nr:hypothetical protein [Croceivirga sp. JEA036]NJB35011.1 hypothetical protein [Croceivirga sp. JEA036]
MKFIITPLLICILLASCSSNVDLAIDNPTDQPVFIKVDDLEVEIPANEVVWVEMGKGDHELTLQNDSLVKHNFDQSLYMINPTLNEYLLMEEYYGSDAFYSSYEMTSKFSSKTVNYMGIEFEGNYDVVDKLINTVTWDYGPREKLPEMVQVESGENYTVLKKLLSPTEFIEMVQQSAGAE